MKRVLFPVSVILLLLLAGCQNPSTKNSPATPTTSNPKTPSDSIMDKVMEGHDAGMSGMGKLDKMKAEIQRLLDSIGKLPAKVRIKLEPARIKMDSLLQQLKTSKSSMEKWMDEFNYDSAKDNADARMKYLEDQNGKISTIKRNIEYSLRKADSLIKAKL